MNWDLSEIITDEIMAMVVMEAMMQKVSANPDSLQKVVDFFSAKYIEPEDDWSNYNALQKQRDECRDTSQSYVATS